MGSGSGSPVDGSRATYFQLDDLDLVLLGAGGDERAKRTLYDRHFDYVYRVVRKFVTAKLSELIEDRSQWDVRLLDQATKELVFHGFAQAFKQLGSYEPSLANFSTWIVSKCRNDLRSTMHANWEHAHPETPPPSPETPPSYAVVDPLDVLVRVEERHAMRKRIRTVLEEDLTKEHATALLLVYVVFEDLGRKAIAAAAHITGRNYPAMWGLLRRARDNFRAHWKRRYSAMAGE